MTGSSMGERLAWARNQQGLILDQVAEVNPTVDAMARLGKALGVSVAFILGEVQAPPCDDISSMLINGQAWTVSQRFRQYLGGRPHGVGSVGEHHRDSYALLCGGQQ